MSTVIGCPHCQGRMSLAPEQGGKQIACPHCQKMFTAPGGAPVARPAAAPVARPVAKPAVVATPTAVPSAAPRPPQMASEPQVSTEEPADERLERFRSRTKSSPVMTIVYIVGGVFVTLMLICGIGGYVIFQKATAPFREFAAEQAAEKEVATNMCKQVLAGNGYTGKLSGIIVFSDKGERTVMGEVAHQGSRLPFQCEFKVRTNNNRSVWDSLEATVNGEVIYTKPPVVAP